VTIEHRIGRLLAWPPERNVRIATACGDAAISKKYDSIHRPVMEAHDLLSYVARERPADR
jgi:hypothetical protein